MSAMENAATEKSDSVISDGALKVSPLLRRKSVLMGMLASGFVATNAAQGSSAVAATAPSYAARWAPSTAFVLGQQVVSPNNDVVSAKVAHTSSATYLADMPKWTHSSTFISKGSAFISAADSGLSTGAAGATNATALQAAIDLAWSSGVQEVRITRGGTYNFGKPITLRPGVHLNGTGSQAVTLNYTGTGSFLVQPSPGVRAYNFAVSNLTLTGPGIDTATVGVDLDSVSTSRFDDVSVIDFGKGIRVGSVVDGGAVYNTFMNCTATWCKIGFAIEASGSNATRFFACRANVCTIGLAITDSNNTTWVGGQIESGGIGVQITATSNAFSDNNLIDSTRFEGNTTAWVIASAFVRYTQIINPATFGTYAVKDAGSSTTHWGGGERSWTTSGVQDALGAFRFTRNQSGGGQLPAFVISDSTTTTGTPVTLQIETGRAAGYFLRGKQGGATKAEITAGGQGRFAAGIGVGNSVAAKNVGAVVRKVQIFDAAGVSLGYIAVYNSIT